MNGVEVEEDTPELSLFLFSDERNLKHSRDDRAREGKSHRREVKEAKDVILVFLTDSAWREGVDMLR